jgi:hypothetical protein
VLIALEAGVVVVESDNGAVEAGVLEGACGVNGPGGGAAGGGEIGVIGKAYYMKFVAGLEVGDGVVGRSGGLSEQRVTQLRQQKISEETEIPVRVTLDAVLMVLVLHPASSRDERLCIRLP